ncbi:MAG: sugar phosphate isomerase/epimerase [Clostridiaceae bacterium]|nr:sugar phosphate isomerase/epimerase [Clostridiaceae bacterium]
MSQIGLQMYTMRHVSGDRESFLNTLDRLVEIGIEDVQISVPAFMTCGELSEELRQRKMKADSVFCSTVRILDSIVQIRREAELLHTDVLRTDSIPAALRKDAAGYRQFASDLNRQGEALKKIGLAYMYHFHAFEFVSFGDIRGIDILLGETDPELVLFQPDVFWLTSAGTEPSDFLWRFANRARYMHVKDYAIRQLEGAIENVPSHFAPVGTGNLNWPGILKTAESIGIERFVIEQDIVEGDVFAAVKLSVDNLKKMGLS